MFESFLQNRSIPPQILTAYNQREQAQKANPGLPIHIWKISQAAAEILLLWRLPTSAVLAALIAPLLEYDLVSSKVLAESFGDEAMKLAERLITWHSSNPTSDDLDAKSSLTKYLQQLRSLFRQAYLDLPKLPFILLLMADHDARLFQNPQESKQLAKETEAVFIPLAEMLGMWNLRSQWLEKCSLVLRLTTDEKCQHEYQDIKKQLDEAHLDTKEGRRKFLEKKFLLKSSKTLTRAQKKWLQENKPLLEKVEPFLNLEIALIKRFKEADIHPKPRIDPIHLRPAISLRRFYEGQSEDKLGSGLGVRILCHTIEDCYHVLGIVHSLSHPLASRFSARFDDYIAAPQNNGYRALHTSIGYEGYKDSKKRILVEFRILTPEMHRLNERGAVVALYHYSSRYQNADAWWNKWDQSTLQKRLTQHDLDTSSDLLYIFSPRGEVFPLDKGSTALDFAYHIHTELGHHAAKIEVNGQSVSYDYLLKNGDLVHVHYDPHFAGPDLAWLELVATSQARAKIRRGLTNRAQATHKGRAIIEDVLIKMIRYYRQEKHYNLSITTGQLETFLFEMKKIRGLPGLDVLYDEIAVGHFSPQKLMRFLISQELGSAIVGANGGRLPYPQHRIFLCDVCRPVPDEPIIAFERRAGTVSKGLIIHRQDSQRCVNHAGQRKQVHVCWMEAFISTNKELFILQITANSRRKVLGDILEIIYDSSGIQLRKVDAQANRDDNADIMLVVQVDTLGDLTKILADIENVPSVLRVLPFPASPSQYLILTPSAAKHQPNPYTSQEVYAHGMFYDREVYINEILDWLKKPVPICRMILHGQRRVGKTSLAKHLTYEILPKQDLAKPVFVDGQGFSGFNAQHLANYLVQAVYLALEKPVPEQQPWEEPIPWLNRALQEATNQLRGYRLLIIIDEFNAFLDRENEGRLDPEIFSNLRAVMNERRDLNWLLIVQNTHFYHPEDWGSAGPLFQEAIYLSLPDLDSHWAQKLIVEPIERCGIQFDEAIPSNVLNLTAGNPYLIQVICREMIDRVRRQKRTNITENDLTHVRELFIQDGLRYFDHFTKNLKGIRKIVLAAIAVSSQYSEWKDLSKILIDLQRREEKLGLQALNNATQALTRYGMLNYDGKSNQVRIPIELFHRWIQHYLDLDDVIEEWNITRFTNQSGGTSKETSYGNS